MKNIVIVLLLLILPFNYLYPQKNRTELGIRYLKLGNTYREVGDFDKALEYVEEGRKIVENKSIYWKAVANEYFGYLYRDIGLSKNDPDEKELFRKMAAESFRKALSLYETVIKQKDGSPAPMKEIEKLIYDLDNASITPQKAYPVTGGPATTFNFDRMKLKECPDGIPDNAQNISLAKNRLNSIPSCIFDLANLEFIDLSENRIKTVAGNIDELHNLYFLDLSKNKLKTVPNEIKDLKMLRVLNLSDNKLKSLPPGICEMRELEILNIRGNKIPFENISNLLKCLPETNILYDEYILKPDESEEGIDE